MRVALRALQGEPERGLADAVEAIDDALDPKLLGDDGAFLVDHAVAQETGGHDLSGRGVGEEIAGDLFDQKLIVGLVAVERVDHPIAPRPLRPRQILLEAVAVGIARHVEPDPRPTLAVGLTGQQPVDGPGRGLGETGLRRRGKSGDLLRRRRQPGEIEIQPPAERRGIRWRRRRHALGRELGGDKGVDRIPTRRPR